MHLKAKVNLMETEIVGWLADRKEPMRAHAKTLPCRRQPTRIGIARAPEHLGMPQCAKGIVITGACGNFSSSDDSELRTDCISVKRLDAARVRHEYRYLLLPRVDVRHVAR